jgi:hypothetical protein
LHRDNFAAKEPGFCPVLSSGNVYSLNRRAVSGKANVLYIWTFPSHKQEFGSPSLQPSLRRQTLAFFASSVLPNSHYAQIKLTISILN